jgi:hypothetical protein
MGHNWTQVVQPTPHLGQRGVPRLAEEQRAAALQKLVLLAAT